MAAELIMGLGAFKTMFDLAKGLKDIDDATKRNGIAITLQEKILAAQAQQAALIERVDELEKEIMGFKNWETEKQRYQLTAVGPSIFAYSLKPEMQASEPSHLLCANCYQDSHKSILQATTETQNRHRVHICPRCKGKLAFGQVPAPGEPCPKCGALEFRTENAVKSRGPFGRVGAIDRTLKCGACGHTETRLDGGQINKRI